MKNLVSLCVLLLCFSQLSFGQNDKTLFGNNLAMSAAWAGQSFTTSQVKDKTIVQSGLDVGFEYNGTFLTGYQWRTSINELELSDLTENNRLKWGNHTFLVGYTMPTNKVIHPRLTIGVGPGTLRLDGVKDKLFVIQPAAGIEINLFQWARLSLEGGYRKVSGVQSSGLSNEDLSKFFGAATLRFGWAWGSNH